MSVRQSRGRYVVEFQQGGSRIFRRCPPGITQAQAKELETKLRRDLFDRGPLGHKEDISLGAAIQLWLENNHRKNQKQAQSEAKQWAEFAKGRLLKEAPEVARGAVRVWENSATTVTHIVPVGRKSFALPASPTHLPKHSTINRRLCVLKAAAKYAWEQSWIDQNVSGKIKLLPERSRREIYLTRAQVNGLGAGAPSAATKAAIMIAAYTGLRASELLAIPRQPSTTTSLQVLQSKSGKPRVVPVPLPARRYLRDLPLGLSYWQLHKQFLEARRKAGLTHVKFHDLRHTCASWLIQAGVDLYTVGKILGHSGPATTARYAHLATATLERAMRRLK